MKGLIPTIDGGNRTWYLEHMKTKCSKCNRQVGVSKGKLSVHRTWRSKPGKVRPACVASGQKA